MFDVVKITELEQKIDLNIVEQKTVFEVEMRPVARDGARGKSAYESYLDTTTDNPVLSETDWSNFHVELFRSL